MDWNTHSLQGTSLPTATPERPGPVRELFRFRDQPCSLFVSANILDTYPSLTEDVRFLLDEVQQWWAIEGGVCEEVVQ